MMDVIQQWLNAVVVRLDALIEAQRATTQEIKLLKLEIRGKEAKK